MDTVSRSTTPSAAATAAPVAPVAVYPSLHPKRGVADSRAAPEVGNRDHRRRFSASPRSAVPAGTTSAPAGRDDARREASVARAAGLGRRTRRRRGPTSQRPMKRSQSLIYFPGFPISSATIRISLACFGTVQLIS